MGRKTRILLQGLLVGLAVLALWLLSTLHGYSAPPTTLSSDVGVCDPWYPQNCYAPLGRVQAGSNQYGVSIAAAVAPTIPDGALGVLVVPRGTNNSSGECLLWRDDGTNPTATVGNPVAQGQALWYYVKSSATSSAPNSSFKVIAASGATCTANFLYYK